MKKILALALAAAALLCLAACGQKIEETHPPVTVSDIAADPADVQAIAPADVNEVSTSSEDPLSQPFAQSAAPPEEMAPPPADTPAEEISNTPVSDLQTPDAETEE